MKKTLIAAAAMLSVTLVQADPGYGSRPYGYGQPKAAPAAPRFSADSPAALTQDGMGKLLDHLRHNDGDLQRLGAFLNREVAPYFDFAYMAKSAAGSLYRHMSEPQRQRLANRIKQQFLSTMVQRLGSYDQQQVKVVSQRLSPDSRTGVVSTAIMGPEGYPARLDFRFYKAKGGWKVFDVMANGQSAVVHYRRQFRRTMYMPSGQGSQLAMRPYRQPTSR